MILNEGLDLLIEELIEESAKTDFISKFGQDTFSKFEKAKQRLRNNGLSTDYQQYLNMSEEELLKLLANQYDTSKERDVQKLRKNQNTGLEIRGKYKYLGEAGGYKVYQPLDYIASMDLGVNTGWCTTGRYEHAGEGRDFVPSAKDAKEHFEEYTNGEVTSANLYYFLDPETMFGKYAIAVYEEPFSVKDFLDNREDLENEFLRNLVSTGKDYSLNYELYDENDALAYEDITKLPIQLIPEKVILEEIKSSNGLIIAGTNMTGIAADFKGPDLIIPEGITAVQFSPNESKAKIRKLVIPASVNKLSYLFGLEGSDIEQIIVDPNNKKYDSRDNCNAIISKANTLILGCKNTVIPANVNRIDFGAFETCTGLKNVVLPERLTIIDINAFANSGLESVVIPANIKEVGRGAFSNCKNLKEVKFLGDDPKIDTSVFDGCTALTTVDLPKKIKELPPFTFKGCANLKNITLPSTLKAVRVQALQNTAITDVYIPANITELEPDAFNFDAATSIVVDTKNPVYDSRDNCNAIIRTKNNKLVFTCPASTIPSSVKIIGTSAFADIKDTKIIIPNGVTTIEGYAFYNCDNVEVVVPDSVKELKETAYGLQVFKNPNNYGYGPKKKPTVVKTNNQIVIDYCKNNDINWESL